VDRASGRGVAGFGIRVEEVEENDAGQESDEQGRFSVELLLERGGILRVMPAGGWVVDVHEYHITPEILRADKEFLVLTSPSGDSAWRFALYDAATGEPVPHFMLAAQVEHGEPIEMLSDQEGRVAVPPELGEGRLSVRCVDHPALMVQWAEEAPLYTVDPPQSGGPESELRIPVGPTYRLKIEGPPELDVADLTATLESLEWVHRMQRSAITGPLRAEGGHWVRFGPTPTPPHSGPPWLLQLRSSPPGLFGEVNVFQFQGVHPGLLDVQVGRVGGIAGYVWNEDDGPLLEAVVTLSVSGSDASGPLRLTPVDGGGAYLFESPRADDYRVGAVAQGYEYKDSALKVSPGQETKYDFRLARDSAFGQVSGELVSVKGEYSLPVTVVLMPQEGGVMFRRNPDWTAGEDGFVAPFVFDEVPVGDYVLRIFPSGGQLWDRYEVDVQCPASDLTFVCRDDREVSSVRIRIYDALTQREIPAMWAFVDKAAGGSSIGQSAIGPVPSGMVISLLVPGESTLAWVVGAPGYVPGYGDESALAEGSSPAGPILSADVHLDPGWGMLLEVLEFQRNSGGSPLSGADIYLDGVHFGKTGTDGRIRLRAAKSPERIEVQHGSSSFMSAEPFDQEGLLTSRFMLRGRVWMRGR